LGTANAHMSIRIVSPKSCHPELGASGCAIWYARLRAYSSSLLALSLSRLLPYTCYIIDCEPSWLFISLLYLQLVDYILYIENSYINNRCATCCASFLPIMQTVTERLVVLAPSWDRKMTNPPPDREQGYYQSAASTPIQCLSMNSWAGSRAGHSAN